MNTSLARIDIVLAQIEYLAGGLQGDPEGQVLRSASALRDAFSARREIEPAVARVRDSVHLLRGVKHQGTRRQMQRHTDGVNHLEEVMEGELVPELRRVGFNV